MRLKFNLSNGCCFNLRSESIVATVINNNTIYIHTIDGKQWSLKIKSYKPSVTDINDYIWGKDIDCTGVDAILV